MKCNKKKVKRKKSLGLVSRFIWHFEMRVKLSDEQYQPVTKVLVSHHSYFLNYSSKSRNYDNPTKDLSNWNGIRIQITKFEYEHSTILATGPKFRQSGLL